MIDQEPIHCVDGGLVARGPSPHCTRSLRSTVGEVWPGRFRILGHCEVVETSCFHWRARQVSNLQPLPSERGLPGRLWTSSDKLYEVRPSAGVPKRLGRFRILLGYSLSEPCFVESTLWKAAAS